MTGTRSTLHQLHALAGATFDDGPLASDHSVVTERVARHRRTRTLVAGATGTAVVALGVVGLALWTSPATVAPAPADSPAASSSAAPSPSATTAAEAPPAECADATWIDGKPYNDVGGLEHRWAMAYSEPCDEWPEEVLAHPNTVVVNTVDGTMLQANVRVDGPDMDAYRDLGPDFLVPDPDPSWPADSFVIIDAATGEVLEAMTIHDPDFEAEAPDETPSGRDTAFFAMLDAFGNTSAMSELPDGWVLIDGTSSTSGTYGPTLRYVSTATYEAYLADPAGAMSPRYAVTLRDVPLDAAVTGPDGSPVQGDDSLLEQELYYDESINGGGIQCPVGRDAYLVVQQKPESDESIFAFQDALVAALREVTGLELKDC
ncbi:hypothetical protein [Demequina gelatinilytica]|uniref:hypothetical protein n=1 Tax=Demequina gelatinilytica TaxID=1638980 RepID=UPI000784CC89|nr:hypothetical protein [Demequina gelatinilytica]